MNQRMYKRVAAIVTLLTAVTILGACTADPLAGGKDEPLETKSAADVKNLVKTYTEAIADQVGAEANNYAVGGVNCQGKGGETATDGRFYMSGGAQVAVPEGSHVQTLERIRDEWLAKGYEIKTFRVFPDKRTGEVSARNPTDGFQLALESTRPPTAMAVIIFSPCYMPVAGERPGEG